MYSIAVSNHVARRGHLLRGAEDRHHLPLVRHIISLFLSLSIMLYIYIYIYI